MPRTPLRDIIRHIRASKRVSSQQNADGHHSTAQETPQSSFDGMLATLISLLPFDLAFLFLGGWLYNRYYLAIFGLDQRLLDLGIYEESAKGFAVAITHPWLVICSLAFLMAPLFWRSLPARARNLISLKALFLGVMLISSLMMGWSGMHYGVMDGTRDISASSQLPTALFRIGATHYTSQVVYLKGDYIFLAGVHNIDDQNPKTIVEIRVFKIEKLDDLKLVGR
jgi:hypothetical protein